MNALWVCPACGRTFANRNQTHSCAPLGSVDAHFAGRIETPLLVIHSEEDWRTPIGQGETMFRALLHQRKPTAMVRFPGENHELSRSGTPSRRVQNQRVIRGWFDKYLLGAEVPEFAEQNA